MVLNTDQSLHLVEMIVSIGILITSLELLSIHPHLKDSGFLSWRVHRLSHPVIAKVWKYIFIDKVIDYPNVLYIITLRIIAVIFVWFFIIAGHSVVFPLCVATVITLLMTLRSPAGNDGSDQMALIILLVSTVAEAIGTPVAKCSALTFIAAQASLAYGTSGFLKFKMAGWYDGSFLLDMLRTSSYGDKRLSRFLDRNLRLAKLLGRGVVYGDCSLAFAIFLPPLLCSSLLVCGIVFHIAIARIMGLNTFLWSFVATYPAIFWVADSLYRGKIITAWF
jgi:hypothetical protein